MRHQVERLKHVAPRQGVKLARALTAAFVAIGMMVTGSVVLSSSTANADDGHNNGAICTSTTEPLGDQTSGSSNDEGIATFVGGDMYVGGKKSGITSANNNNAPEGSYAVEAEGLTAVNGKLLLHPMKQAWNIWNKDGSNRSRGFRWGIVGFGSQFRPKDGSTVLSVGGNSTNSELNWFGGAQGWTDNANQGSSWLGTGAGNGATGETNDHNFNANIAGNQTTVQSRNNWTNGEQYSVYAMGGNGKVNWNGSSTDISGVKNPSTGSDYTYSDYKEYVAALSGKLANISSSNTTVTKGDEYNYTGSRYSYSYNTYENNVYRFDIQNDSRQTEITLTGNGKGELQVFNLDASMLNSIGDAGVVFNFKNIPDNASVVVNINGNGNNVKFRNGWQFKWNDVDISDGYVMMKSTGGNRYDNEHGQDYVKRASQLMWNFYNTNSLTILGGKGSGHINTGSYKPQNHGDKPDWYNVNVTDDPSAAWMGSVMVTGKDSGGNFQSHVSTNGRVWTTGDFEMYNKDVVTTDNGNNFVDSEGKYSTSAVDMDQERHNLPWYGQMTTSCAAIKWNKVDTEDAAVKGTSWTVYGTKDNAVSNANPIATVADGGWNDADNADNGSVTLGSLAKNATYYVRESGTGSSKYAQNTNIYRIVTQDSTDTVSTIDKVYTAAGDDITAKDGDAKQLNNGAIVNVSAGASITWSKVDAEEPNALLAGSTWELTKKGNPDQSWTIKDDDSDSEIANIVVKINGTEASSWNFTDSTPVSISYVAVDKNGKELATKVQWKSEKPAVAGIASDGTQLQLQPYSNGTTKIMFTAGDKTLTFPVTVNGVTVESSISIDDYTEGQEISLEQDKTMKLTANVAPAEGNTVNWSSSNTDDVSVSPLTGTTVTVTAKNTTSSYVTITATEQRGKKKASLKIKVTEPMVSVYFKKSNVQWSNYWLKYKKSTDGPAWSGDVQSSSVCGDYVRFQLPKSSVATNYEFYLGNAQGLNLTATNIYQAANKTNFRFTGNSVQVVETYNNYQGSTAPSGCTATSAYVENRSRRSAVKNAVFYDQPVARAITNTTAKAADTLPDEEPKAGQLKVSNLPDGTYTLKETSAPNGYDASKETYNIVIKNGQIDHSDLPEKVENPRFTGKVTWQKTNENTGKLLGGSKWKLYKTKSFTWNNGKAEYTEGDSITPIATITDYVGSKTCSAQTEQYTDCDGNAGAFELDGLEWGEYQLVESKAPAGYNIDSNPHTFRIGPAEGANVKGKWYTSSGFNPETTADYQESAAFTIDGGPITNTAGVVLPDTGGEGVNKMYAAGFLAVAIAMVGLALSLKRRQS